MKRRQQRHTVRRDKIVATAGGSRVFEGRSVRAVTAYAAIGINACTILGAFYYVGDPAAWPQVKDLMQVIVPIETLLLGGVVGHYFGSDRSRTGDVHEDPAD